MRRFPIRGRLGAAARRTRRAACNQGQAFAKGRQDPHCLQAARRGPTRAAGVSVRKPAGTPSIRPQPAWRWIAAHLGSVRNRAPTTQAERPNTCLAGSIPLGAQGPATRLRRAWSATWTCRRASSPALPAGLFAGSEAGRPECGANRGGPSKSPSAATRLRQSFGISSARRGVRAPLPRTALVRLRGPPGQSSGGAVRGERRNSGWFGMADPSAAGRIRPFRAAVA